MNLTRKLALLALPLSLTTGGSLAVHAQSAARAVKAAPQRVSSKTTSTARAKVVTSSGTATSAVSLSALSTDQIEQRKKALTSNLLSSCLRSRCAGDIAFAACFNDQDLVEDIMRSDTACTTLLNREPLEIQEDAKQRVIENIRAQNERACSGIGGVRDKNGDIVLPCKIRVTFTATRQDTGETIKKLAKGNFYRDFEVGKNVTCSPSTFSVSDTDMQYTPEKTIEQQVATINAFVGLGQNVLQGAMSGMAWKKASDELKKGEDGVFAGFFTFNGASLWGKESCGIWQTSKDIQKNNKDCTSDGDVIRTTDSRGNCYELNTLVKNLSDGCKAELVSSAKTGDFYGDRPKEIQWLGDGKCGLINATDWHAPKKRDGEKRACQVFIKFASTSEKASVQASLIKSFGIMEQSEAKRAADARINQIRQQIMTAQLLQRVQTEMSGKQGDVMSRWCSADSARELNECLKELGVPPDARCMDRSTRSGGRMVFQQECAWTVGGKAPNEDFFERNKGCPSGQTECISGFERNMEALVALLNPQDNNIGTFAGAMNAFNDAQRTINAEAERVRGLNENLEEAKEDVKNSIVAIGGNILEMAVTDMTYKNTRAQAKGQCFAYGGSGAYYSFATEGQTKRLTWSGF